MTPTVTSSATFPQVAIVIVGASMYGGGGAERRFFRLWRYFNERGKALIVMTNRALFDSAVDAGLLTPEDVGERLRVVPDAGVLNTNLAIFRELRATRPQIVHLPLAQRALVPLILSLAWPSKRVVTHSMTATYFARKSPVPLGTLALSRFLWRICRRIDSLYQGFVPTCAEPLGFAERVSVAPCSFTDPARFERRPPDTAENVVVFSGRLYQEKNPVLFVRALSLLHQRRPDLSWRAVIAGDGPLSGAVRDLIAAGGLDGRVSVGVYPDTAPLLRRSSIFVSLQQIENYPSQALLEAMAAGNAVVATDVGETRRLVRPHETGILVPADVSELATALADLISRPAEARRLGQNAALLVRSEHTIERFASYIEGFWREAAGPVPSR